MFESAQKAIAQVTQAFSRETGPAHYRFSDAGWFYQDEGQEIADALLDLDPSDLEFADLYLGHNTYLPHWCNQSGLKWLIPGIIRVAFEHPEGHRVLQNLFEELDRRGQASELELTIEQQQSLLAAHDTFYSIAIYHWNPSQPEIPWVRRMRTALPLDQSQALRD